MSSIFDKLKDDAPPPPSEDIGRAVADVMENVARSNSTLATMLAMSIAEAISKIDSRNIVVDRPESRDVKQWSFKVIRDANGRMTEVIARAD